VSYSHNQRKKMRRRTRGWDTRPDSLQYLARDYSWNLSKSDKKNLGQMVLTQPRPFL